MAKKTGKRAKGAAKKPLTATATPIVQQPSQPAAPLKPTLPEEESVMEYYLDCMEDGVNAPMVIQIVIMAFFANLMLVYANNLQEASPDDDTVMDPFYCALIILGSSAFQLVGTLWVGYQQYFGRSEGAREGMAKPTLPAFDYIYCVFIPVIVCLLAFPEKISLVGSCVGQFSYLHPYVRLVSSYVIMLQLPVQPIPDNFQTRSGPLVFLGSYTALTKFMGESLSMTERNLLSHLVVALTNFVEPEAEISIIILQKLFLSYGVALGLAALLSVPYNAAEGSVKTGLLALIYVVFFGSGTYLADRFLSPVLGKAPWQWIVDYIEADPSLVSVFTKWAVTFTILVPLVLLVSTKIPGMFRRKIWHFAIFGALCTTIYDYPQLTSIALVGLFGLFCMIEIVRANDLPPAGRFLRQTMAPFEDSKDHRGKYVLSYIYLVLGIALPLWLNNASGKGSSVVGLVILGLGDSLASIVGRTIGKLYWPSTKKTMEGSFAFFLATAIALYKYQSIGENSFNNYSIIISSMLAAILEANITMNDNVVIPLFGYIGLEAISRVS